MIIFVVIALACVVRADVSELFASSNNLQEDGYHYLKPKIDFIIKPQPKCETYKQPAITSNEINIPTNTLFSAYETPQPGSLLQDIYKQNYNDKSVSEQVTPKYDISKVVESNYQQPYEKTKLELSKPVEIQHQNLNYNSETNNYKSSAPPVYHYQTSLPDPIDFNYTTNEQILPADKYETFKSNSIVAKDDKLTLPFNQYEYEGPKLTTNNKITSTSSPKTEEYRGESYHYGLAKNVFGLNEELPLIPNVPVIPEKPYIHFKYEDENLAKAYEAESSTFAKPLETSDKLIIPTNTANDYTTERGFISSTFNKDFSPTGKPFDTSKLVTQKPIITTSYNQYLPPQSKVSLKVQETLKPQKPNDLPIAITTYKPSTLVPFTTPKPFVPYATDDKYLPPKVLFSTTEKPTVVTSKQENEYLPPQPFTPINPLNTSLKPIIIATTTTTTTTPQPIITKPVLSLQANVEYAADKQALVTKPQITTLLDLRSTPKHTAPVPFTTAKPIQSSIQPVLTQSSSKPFITNEYHSPQPFQLVSTTHKSPITATTPSPLNNEYLPPAIKPEVNTLIRDVNEVHILPPKYIPPVKTIKDYLPPSITTYKPVPTKTTILQQNKEYISPSDNSYKTTTSSSQIFFTTQKPEYLPPDQKAGITSYQPTTSTVIIPQKPAYLFPSSQTTTTTTSTTTTESKILHSFSHDGKSTTIKPVTTQKIEYASPSFFKTTTTSPKTFYTAQVPNVKSTLVTPVKINNKYLPPESQSVTTTNKPAYIAPIIQQKSEYLPPSPSPRTTTYNTTPKAVYSSTLKSVSDKYLPPYNNFLSTTKKPAYVAPIIQQKSEYLPPSSSPKTTTYNTTPKVVYSSTLKSVSDKYLPPYNNLLSTTKKPAYIAPIIQQKSEYLPPSPSPITTTYKTTTLSPKVGYTSPSQSVTNKYLPPERKFISTTYKPAYIDHVVSQKTDYLAPKLQPVTTTTAYPFYKTEKSTPSSKRVTVEKVNDKYLPPLTTTKKPLYVAPVISEKSQYLPPTQKPISTTYIYSTKPLYTTEKPLATSKVFESVKINNNYLPPTKKPAIPFYNAPKEYSTPGTKTTPYPKVHYTTQKPTSVAYKRVEPVKEYLPPSAKPISTIYKTTTSAPKFSFGSSTPTKPFKVNDKYLPPEKKFTSVNPVKPTYVAPVVTQKFEYFPHSIKSLTTTTYKPKFSYTTEKSVVPTNHQLNNKYLPPEKKSTSINSVKPTYVAPVITKKAEYLAPTFKPITTTYKPKSSYTTQKSVVSTKYLPPEQKSITSPYKPFYLGTSTSSGTTQKSEYVPYVKPITTTFKPFISTYNVFSTEKPSVNQKSVISYDKYLPPEQKITKTTTIKPVSDVKYKTETSEAFAPFTSNYKTTTTGSKISYTTEKSIDKPKPKLNNEYLPPISKTPQKPFIKPDLEEYLPPLNNPKPKVYTTTTVKPATSTFDYTPYFYPNSPQPPFVF